MIYDLVIIGAGVASTSALITLKDVPLKIGVVAPEERPSFRIGETLGPVGTEELNKLGILEDFVKEDHWPSFQKFSCWGSDTLVPLIYQGQSNKSWYLDRISFEAFLWKKAQETVFEHLATKVNRAHLKDDLWNIETSIGNITSRMILDASGRSSVIARNHFSRQRHDKLVAAYVVLEQTSDEVEATQATLVEAMPNGWFYSVLVPGNKLVVSWFTDSDLLPQGTTQNAAIWQELLQRSKYTLKRIETAEFDKNALPEVVDASTITTDSIATSNFLTAGDAAVCFDPLSSHGMTTALWSGRRAAESIPGLLEGDSSSLTKYVDSFTQGTKQYLLERQQTYRLEGRFRDESFWERRHT